LPRSHHDEAAAHPPRDGCAAGTPGIADGERPLTADDEAEFPVSLRGPSPVSTSSSTMNTNAAFAIISSARDDRQRELKMSAGCGLAALSFGDAEPFVG
jgi:hypothetical protein